MPRCRDGDAKPNADDNHAMSAGNHSWASSIIKYCLGNKPEWDIGGMTEGSLCANREPPKTMAACAILFC